MELQIADWNVQEETGYEPKTTFYSDFSIADHFGTSAILDTFDRAFNEWKSDVVYVTELCLVMNWKCWEHYSNGNKKVSELYCDLYEKVRDWCLDNLKDDDAEYFFAVTD